MLFKSLAAVSALSLFASSAVAVDASLKNNVAVYYGQGYNQPRLKHFCEQTTSDIINIGFINQFPKHVGDFPGSNFANQCNGAFFPGTELLSGCHQIWQDIPSCKAAGKTILLSIGGGTATAQSIPDEATAVWFADFLWYSFGPYNPAISSLGWTEELAGLAFPRPFLTSSVDGFDFDIEYNGGVGYAAMINRLRWHFTKSPEQTYYISGAPQCPIPDAQLSNAIANSHFDFIWVQWYNTGGCSAADWVHGTGKFNFDDWVGVIEKSANPNAKLFIGLPASKDAANAGFYLTPKEVKPLVKTYMNKHPKHFGGVMLWEATAGDNNLIDGSTYTEHIKDILYDFAPPPPPPSSSVTPIQSSTATPVPSSTVPPSSSATTSVSSVSSSSVASSSSIASSSSVASSSAPATSGQSSTSSVPSSSVTPGASSPSGEPTPHPSSSRKPTHSSHSHPGHGHGHGSHTHTHTRTHTVPSSTSLVSSNPSSTALVSSATESGPSTSEGVIPTGDSSTSDESTGGSKPTGDNSTGGSKPTGGETTGGSKPTGSDSTTTPTGITATPSITASPSSLAPGTTTTIIVTSYIDICPTGFTTITTTITKTYCPGDSSATATPTGNADITAPTSGPATSTASIPEGWTTTVTVCTQCAATPTTVTLTKPAATTTTEVLSQPTAPSVPEGYTTTVTYCNHCGPTGSTITLTVPAHTATAAIPGAGSGSGSGSSGNGEGSGSGSNPGSGSGSTGEVTVPGAGPVVPSPSSKVIPSNGAGGFHAGRPSSSIAFHPSPSRTAVPAAATTATNTPAAPSSNPEGVSPVYTGAASRSSVTGFFSGVLAVALSMFMML